jgi:DMSO reductase anchor subunit
MTVLTQLSVGAFVSIWLSQLLGSSAHLGVAAFGSLILGALALASSTAHLGRPIHAYRALKMWKRSWLSREVLLFGLFSGMAALYAASLWLVLPFSQTLGALTAISGTAGITASAFIYLVPARPSWNNKFTIADFFLTAAILGPLFAANISVGNQRSLMLITVVAAATQLLNQALKFLWLTASDSFELQASARLLSTTLARQFLLRGALLLAGGIALPLVVSRLAWIVALLMAFSGEIVSRYLFYVSVVPKNIAAPYLASSREAA